MKQIFTLFTNAALIATLTVAGLKSCVDVERTYRDKAAEVRPDHANRLSL